VVNVVEWLGTAEAGPPLEQAAAAWRDHPGDPLAAGTRLRRAEPTLSAEQASAALDQASLRSLARLRYGLDADHLLLTRDGLEQATRPQVAAQRASILARSGAHMVVDLTAGLGFDAAAMIAAGLSVIAVEQDPATAVMLRHNVPAAEVVQADATAPGVLRGLLARLHPTDVVFVDPARRSPGSARDLATGRARPERDPERWSPPWSFVSGIAHPRIALKAAPSFSPPPGWQAQWTSVDRVVVECGAYSWPALPADRQALVQIGAVTRSLSAAPDPLPAAGGIGAWLIEADPAIQRAQATSGLGPLQPGLATVDAESTWLTCTSLPTSGLSGLVRAYSVIAELRGSIREQRGELRRRGIDALAVKSRDVHIDPRKVLRDLGCREGSGLTVILTRREGRAISVLVDPVPVPTD
jgi:hypothetical protein